MEIFARAVGRRKEAVAQVQIVRGTGQFLINDKPAEEYLQNNSFSMLLVKSPFFVLTSPTHFVGSKESMELIQNGENSTNSNGQKPLYLTRTVNEKVGSPSAGPFNDYNMSFDQFDIIVKVKGGGLLGQAEAIKLAVSKAISIIDYSKTEVAQRVIPNFNLSQNSIGTLALEVRKQLKTKGYLTQDSRVKERRKYGLKKARKASQYHKR